MDVYNLIASSNYGIYHRPLAHKIGLHNSIILCELVSEYNYFKEKNQLEDGCFYSTIENLQKYTTLNEYYQRKSLNELKNLELIDVFQKGMPSKRFIKLNEQNIQKLVLGELVENKVSKNYSSRSLISKGLDLDDLETNDPNINNPNTNISVISKDITSNSSKKAPSSVPDSVANLAQVAESSEEIYQGDNCLERENKNNIDNTTIQNGHNINTQKENNLRSTDNTTKHSKSLFSVPAKKSERAEIERSDKFLAQCEYQTRKYKFSQSTLASLDTYFRMLAANKKYLAWQSIDSQLALLLTCVDPEKAVALTVARGWLSLDYAIENINKQQILRGPYEKPKELDKEGNTISTLSPQAQKLREVINKANELIREGKREEMLKFRKECIENGLCTEEEFPV